MIAHTLKDIHTQSQHTLDKPNTAQQSIDNGVFAATVLLRIPARIRMKVSRSGPQPLRRAFRPRNARASARHHLAIKRAPQARPRNTPTGPLDLRSLCGCMLWLLAYYNTPNMRLHRCGGGHACPCQRSYTGCVPSRNRTSPPTHARAQSHTQHAASRLCLVCV